MFSVSDLSPEQIESIKSWVAEGAQMADVQKRITDDFGFKVTYMDTRFLSLDLELAYHVDEEPEPEPEPESATALDSPLAPDSPAAAPQPSPLGVAPEEGAAMVANVGATLDQVARPGSMVSGTVTFSDGMKGVWMIDEQGRPSVDPDQPGYQPTEADLFAFQGKLRDLLDGQV